MGKDINHNPLDSAWGTSHLDFTTFPPEIFYGHTQMNFRHTNTSICGYDGELFFYTNGIYVEIGEGDTMQYGEDLHEWNEDGDGYAQGAICLPYPDDTEKYVLILGSRDYINEDIGFAGTDIKYHIIDMKSNGGLGAVVDKHNVIVNTTNGLLDYGKLTAVKHANGRDWWLLFWRYDSNKCFRVLINDRGVQPFEIDSVALPINTGLGQACFSPDGSKYAILNLVSLTEPHYLDIHDFDRCTGKLSNQIRIHHDEPATYSGGVAFSSNNRFLYLSSFDNVYQLDLWADDIEGSQIEVAVLDYTPSPELVATYFLAQLGPDGKIYLNANQGVNVLHVINQPDNPGTACEFDVRGVKLPTRNAFSLPNFPNYRLGPVDGSTCDTLGIDNIPLAGFRYDVSDLETDFTSVSWYEPENWSWDFGDGNMSVDVNSVHIYDSSGMYDVCLTVSNQYGQDTHCKLVTVDKSTSTSQLLPDNAVTIGPNPVRDVLNLWFNGRYADEVSRFEIWDIYGQFIYGYEVSDHLSAQINISALSMGTYICVGKNGDGLVIWREKFVVIK